MLERATVAAQIFEEGHRFEFFQAIRVLNALYPHKGAVGYARTPSDEAVRFHSYPSLSFPPSPIYDIATTERADDPVHLTVAFLGLTGPQGVLPRHYTELVLERLRERDRTLLDFFDLFTHRFVSLFYRSWEKYSVPVTFERAQVQQTGTDRVLQALSAFAGLGTRGLEEQLACDRSTVLGYAGLVAQRPRSAVALTHLLRDYFGVPVAVNQFMGEWLTLAESDCTRLTNTGLNNRLGETALAGTRVWDQQGRFQLRVGALQLDDFMRMLPSGETYEVLVQLTRFFVGETLNFDIRLVLRGGEVPACILGDTGACPPKLGWTTWLKGDEFTRDVDDVVFPAEHRWTPPRNQEAPLAAVA